MGMCVCGGAGISCSFGMAPAALNVLPAAKVISGMPLATIMDKIPLLNITPFGMCSSILNPQVIAATTAAFGVLTPMPCLPVTLAPWTPGSPAVLVGGYPALNQSSKLMCIWGGVISVTSPGVMNVLVP